MVNLVAQCQHLQRYNIQHAEHNRLGKLITTAAETAILQSNHISDSVTNRYDSDTSDENKISLYRMVV